MDWQATQNQDYLLLLQRRLDEPRLMWVDQFVGLINELVNTKGRTQDILINDFGCNVGHFYRGVQAINGKIDYCGYDISETYLLLARKNFPKATFMILDISGCIVPRTADVAVISATLEHIADHQSAIKNIFDTTTHAVIMRTFVGDSYICEACRTEGARDEYIIKQFTFDDLTLYPKKVGWGASLVADNATESKPKFVCNGQTILRSQQIIVFTRNDK